MHKKIAKYINLIVIKEKKIYKIIYLKFTYQKTFLEYRKLTWNFKNFKLVTKYFTKNL